MMQYIGPAAGLLFTIENIIWINLGVFIGAVFAAIPGLSVISVSYTHLFAVQILKSSARAIPIQLRP